MDLSYYFTPIASYKSGDQNQTSRSRIGNLADCYTEAAHFPELKEPGIALLGVIEDRGALENSGCHRGPDAVRKHFYELHSHWKDLKLSDLGNVRKGNTIDDTYFAVKEIISVLIAKNILPIIVGGSQDLTYANYLAYENIGKVINFAAIDPQFDLGQDEHELHSRSYLSRIILHQPNYLFNFTNLGYQSYYTDHDAIILMKNLFFDAHRLGSIRGRLEEVEPMIRNADLLSFDMSSIRSSDAPGNFFANPNGFNGEEACQICRYAGLSDKLSSIGFYEFNPDYDRQGQTASLLAQMIWYFIDGYMHRKNDMPEEDTQDYIRFTVKVEGFEEQLVFLKSKQTERWWMEVQSVGSLGEKYRRHRFVPCSYADYQAAMNQEIPDRWWKVHQKLM